LPHAIANASDTITINITDALTVVFVTSVITAIIYRKLCPISNLTLACIMIFTAILYNIFNTTIITAILDTAFSTTVAEKKHDRSATETIF
jgi:hypothetical protein